MFAKNIVCSECNKKLQLELFYKCPNCGGILGVDYNYDEIKKENDLDMLFNNKAGNIWHYKVLLPIEKESNIITISEGSTPLINLDNLGEKYGLKSLFIKDETRNSTASFKDRPTSVAISKAKELGYSTITLSSSGNAAAAAAAYAARGNMKSVIFVPENTAFSKVKQAYSYGAKIIKVKGSYSNAYKVSLLVSEKYKWVNLTSTYLNPYTLEGDKTIAYELYEQLNGVIPKYIVVPVGAGPLLYGIYKGYQELKKLGKIHETPSMIGVQAEKCSPIIQAFEKNHDEVTVNEYEHPHTIAGGIADPLIGYEMDGTKTLKTIYKSDGIGVSLKEGEIAEGVIELSSKEGIYSEPSAAASWAGLKKLLKNRKIMKEDKIVLINTGHGLKQSIDIKGEDIPVIEPNLNSFDKIKNQL